MSKKIMELIHSIKNIPIRIEGEYGEGGGSILRLAVGLSASTQIPIHITNIRKNRNPPGLKTQHLTAIKSIAELTGGKISPKPQIGTEDLTFSPGKEWKEAIRIHVRTAGSVALITQALYYALILAPPKTYSIIIEGGGTYGTHAPSPAFLNHVTFPLLKAIGYNIRINVKRQGFYPKGGSISELTINPSPSYKGLILTERGSIKTIKVIAYAHERLRKPQVCERIISSLNQHLPSELKEKVESSFYYENTPSIGVGADAIIYFDKGSILAIPTQIGKKGLKSETIGKNMAKEILTLLSLKETIDPYTADQIIAPLAFSEEPSEFYIREKTLHFTTNLYVLSKFINRPINIEKTEDHLYHVKIPSVQ